MRYPDSPGFKSRGTSSLAARRIAPHAEALRDRVFAFLMANYPAPFTADEVADRLGVSILSVRPRVSELRSSQLIELTAERRRNKSGMMAHCWRGVLSSTGMVHDTLKDRGGS
jgi:predicted ArsR family transcriptional regulator